MYVPTNNYHTCSTSDEGQKAAVLPENGINFVALSQPGHSQKKKMISVSNIEDMGVAWGQG